MSQTGQFTSMNSQGLSVTADSDPTIQGRSVDVLSRVKPSLQRGVRLVGQMKGVGFEDDQWLIERNGDFVLATELLYRVAEHANGVNTVDEIAQKVTDSTAWIVTASDVQLLIDTKLVPLQLVASDTRDENQVETRPEGEPAALLSVNLRIRALSPRYIAPVTKFLQIFCNAPAVLCVLIAAGWVHWWLYGTHGIGASIRDTIYTPGGLLLVFAAICAGAIFHEFGHASVLRSQGGQVRTMGVGLYLLYPAFYTDVSDSYRLGRWSRVFTDLGGIYFHLIFVLFVFGIYRLTGREFLLFAVLLIDLEIVSQFIPLGRLDGYWLLADLSGIPDFFSLMVPFLHSLVPGLPEALGHNRLPALKKWVSVTFAIYLLGAVPLLTYVFLLLLRGLPYFLAQSWEALRTDRHLLSQISVRTDHWTAALLLVQMFLLCLTMVATMYFVWLVVNRAISSGWRWARDKSTKKVAFAIALGSLGLFVMAPWVPSGVLSTVHRRANRGDELLGETKTAIMRLQSLRTDVDGSLGEDHFTATVVLERPNRARIDVSGTKGLGHMLLVSDGVTLQTYYPDDKRYVKLSPGESGENVQSFIIEQVDCFFRPEEIKESGVTRYVGQETIDGVVYERVAIQLTDIPKGEVRYWISRTDKLIHRIVITDGSGRVQHSSTLANVQTNLHADPRAFILILPRTAEPLEFPAGLKLPIQQQ